MKKYMELPADYAVLSDDEMTYTTGGSAVGGIVTIVGVASATICPNRLPTSCVTLFLPVR